MSGRYLDVGQVGEACLSPMESFKLPADKIEAETVIMAATAGNLSQMSLEMPFLGYRKIEGEGAPDFAVDHGSIGDGYAELTEIVKLSGPYEEAPRWIEVRDLIDAAVERVKEKQIKYKNRSFKPIMLILYTTHNTFTLSNLMIALVACEIKEILEDVFHTIAVTNMGFRGGSFTAVLYPSTIKIASEYKAKLKSMLLVSPDPSLLEARSEISDNGDSVIGMTIHFPLGVDVARAAESLEEGLWDVPVTPPSEETRRRLARKRGS